MDTPDKVELPDHYAALRVEASASQQEIARAYRARMRSLHPDVDVGPRNPGGADGNAAARKNELLRIMQAFAVLRDPARRAAYDRSLAERQMVSRPETGPQSIPVRRVRSRENRAGATIRITPVRWESGPWA
jgi:DnaJ-class molecular chaperone